MTKYIMCVWVALCDKVALCLFVLRRCSTPPFLLPPPLLNVYLTFYLGTYVYLYKYVYHFRSNSITKHFYFITPYFYIAFCLYWFTLYYIFHCLHILLLCTCPPKKHYYYHYFSSNRIIGLESVYKGPQMKWNAWNTKEKIIYFSNFKTTYQLSRATVGSVE